MSTTPSTSRRGAAKAPGPETQLDLFRTKSDRPTLVWQLTNRGFGSEINVMLLAILYCLDKGYNFLLYSRSSNLSYKHGWRDYFLPFCHEVDHFALRRALIFNKRTLFVRSILAVQRACLLLAIPGPFFLTQDKWGEIWNSNFQGKRFFMGPDFDIDSYTACRTILLAIWRLNSTIQYAVTRIESEGIAGNAPYCTIHIRRGDKVSEAAHVPIHKYMEKVREVNPGIVKVFVMTDDFHVIQDLAKEYPSVQFSTLCAQDRTGHIQQYFNRASKTYRRAEICRLLAELEIARKGDFFVGTSSSNIGRLVCLLRGNETTHGIDDPKAVI